MINFNIFKIDLNLELDWFCVVQRKNWEDKILNLKEILELLKNSDKIIKEIEEKIEFRNNF